MCHREHEHASLPVHCACHVRAFSNKRSISGGFCFHSCVCMCTSRQENLVGSNKLKRPPEVGDGKQTFSPIWTQLDGKKKDAGFPRTVASQRVCGGSGGAFGHRKKAVDFSAAPLSLLQQSCGEHSKTSPWPPRSPAAQCSGISDPTLLLIGGWKKEWRTAVKFLGFFLWTRIRALKVSSPPPLLLMVMQIGTGSRVSRASEGPTVIWMNGNERSLFTVWK